MRQACIIQLQTRCPFFNATLQAQTEATQIPAPLLDKCSISAPTGHHPTGGKCCFFPGTGTSPSDPEVIHIRADQISAVLSRGRATATNTDGTSAVHVCHSPRGRVIDTQVLPFSHPLQIGRRVVWYGQVVYSAKPQATISKWPSFVKGAPSIEWAGQAGSK